MNNNILAIYELSPLQEGMYFHNMMDDKSTSYHVQNSFILKDTINTERIKQALIYLASRYEVLKTSIAAPKSTGKPWQIILKDREIEVVEYDCKALEFDAVVKQMNDNDLKRGFDLQNDSLMRVNLIKGSEKNLIQFSFHHIIMDGWSMSILFGNFLKYYNWLKEGKSNKEISEQIEKEKRKGGKFNDYIQWLGEQDKEDGLNYWKELIKDYEETAQIKSVETPKKTKEQMNRLGDSLKKEESQKLMKLAKENQVTINTITEAAWGVVLQKYNNSEDVIFGKVVSGRDANVEGIGEIVGLFVNTIPVRVKSDKETSAKDLWKKLQKQGNEGNSYHYCSLAEIQKESRQGSELIKTLFAFENYYVNKDSLNEGSKGLPLVMESAREQTSYSISMTANHDGEQLYMEVMYNPNEYGEREIQRLLHRMKQVLIQFGENESVKIKDLELITEEEKDQVLTAFNNTFHAFPREKTVVELFEEQVKLSPQKTAVVYGGKSLSYQELNEKANQLAFVLREMGVTRECCVGIVSEPSLEMIIGIYGIIKAGGAYIPMDPEYPKERLHYMIEDSKPQVVLTYQAEIETEREIIDLGDLKAYEGAPKSNPERINKPQDLIYVIYTSGTTGKPKGVLIEHRGVVCLKDYLKKTYEVTEEDNVLQFANYVFDASVWEMTMALLHGATLTVVPNEMKADVHRLSSYVEEAGISLTLLPPQYYLQTEMKGLRILTTGGSAADSEVVKKAGSGKYINAYGPTENTVVATHWEPQKDQEIGHNIPIGKPITNTRVYILDGDKLCGIGLPGELCITGESLARGYLNQEELTREKFIDNPYGEGRIYRTGDLARWLEDGNIEYLGRIDEQVKIRGFRIELGEIETVLRKQPGVKEAAVAVFTDSSGDKALYGYVTAKESVTISDLKAGLSKELPEYMVPGYLMKIEKIPVTKSGKLDKRNLPKFEAKTENVYIAARSEKEIILCEIFQEILGVEKVGVNDSFFELGGHSLRATRLVNRIEARMGMRIGLKEVFRNATAAMLARLLEGKEDNYKRIPKAEHKESYMMSSSQKRTYLIQEMDRESTVYNTPGALKLTGEVDVDGLKNALNTIVARHEILRTDFVMEEGELKQKIRETAKADFVYIEDEKTPEKELIKGFVRAFDLSKSPLVRMKLIKREKHDLLLIDMHHIVGDGMSMGIFLNEFSEVYNGLELKELEIQYKDYSEWMRGRDLTSQKEYWKEIFEEEIPVLDLPLDYPRPKEQSFKGGMKAGKLKKETGKRIRELSKESKSTEYMVFLSAVMALLGRYSRQEDVVIGSPVSGRTHADTEHMLGMFVNTLAMRGKPEREKSYHKLLKEVKEGSLKAYENQEYPFEELVEEVEVRRDLSRNPLFDVMLVMQNNEQSEFNLNNIKVEPAQQENRIAKFDLTFTVMEENDDYIIALEYCSDLYKESSAERMLHAYISVLDQISENKEIKIKDLELISEKEKEQIITTFNNENSAYPEKKTVVELFEKQAKLRPNETAVVYEGKSLSYQKLNERANQLAHILREKGVKRDTYVGIVSERSLEMIIGIYGVLKAGGAYVPMDPEYPSERIHYMIEDCKPKVVLTYKALIHSEREVIDLGDPKVYESAPVDNPKRVNKPEDLLYVIYTSGTTGKPKGVQIEHRNVVRLLFHEHFQFDFSEEDTWMMFHSYCFDFSVWEMYGPTLRGGKLIVLPKEKAKDPRAVLKTMEENHVTVLNQVPSSFYNLMYEKGPGWNAVRYLIFGGEALQTRKLKRWAKEHKQIKIINMYGITETTVHTTYREIGTKEIEKGISDIGSAIPTLQIYIQDGNQLCGIGVPGELCIAGAGLARGYLNQEALTKEKFIDNPYGKGRLYRTGDLARWHEDGNIEYMGRIDEQVKIRGFRIELGEVESVLRKQQGVINAAVIVRVDRNGDKALYGYMVAEEEVEINAVREGMSRELPEYMVPGYLMKIEKIPVTKNGKLDKKSLPEIEVRTGNLHVEPRNERETILCEIYKEILGVEKVSVKDSFFELGGHSLRATRLVNQIEAKTGVRVGLKEVFGNTTVEQLSILLEGKEGYYENIPRAEKKESYEMSSSQKRTYLIQAMDPHSIVYNMPGILKLKGKVDVEKLEKSLKKLVQRHEILRTDFVMENGELKQRIRETAEVDFVYIEDEKTSSKELMKKFIRAFDLSKSPLVRMELVKRKEDHLLLSDMHHIVGDGMSMEIFLREFSKIYNGETLEELKVQYKDYSEWMKERDLNVQKQYWKGIFEEEIPVLDMPSDYSRPKEQSFQGGMKAERMGKEAGQRIRELAKETGGTEYMVFLSAAMALLGRYSRQEDVVVGSPVSGRTHRDMESMLGMFVNTLAMRGKPNREKSYQTLLEEVKEESLKAYENQEYPFEELVEEVDVKRDLSRNPLFDVMLVMQNNEQAFYNLNGIDVEPVEQESKIAKLDLTFYIMEENGGYIIALEYCSDLYKESSADRILKTYIRILEQVSENKRVRIKDLELIGEEEKNQVLTVFNDTHSDYPTEKTVVELFEEQVELRPEDTAVMYEGKTLSYRELNEKANQLAHVLREKGVDRDSYVGIMSERSLEMIIGIYGIIKAGGAYIPIDPKYPKERIHYMINDSKPNVVLTYMADLVTEVEVIDLGNSKVYEGASKNNPERVNKPEDLLYVIYTSGTTGKPKGVLCHHKGLINRVIWMHNNYPIHENDVILQKTTYTFDVSVWEIFWWGIVGAAVALLKPGGEKEPEEICKAIEREQVTVMHFVPSMLGMMEEHLKAENEDISKLKSLRWVFASGEALKEEHVKQFSNLFQRENKKVQLINVYGPTEASIDVTYYNCGDNAGRVPIGKPISNTKIYILDGDKLCGIGLPGELCIAGDGLARGYLNQEALTKEKFIDNPYEEGKLYRTGDLARWHEDGNIEYLGRIDDQVKIRGFRIELGEIEAVLKKQPGVNEAVVIARTDRSGDNTLYGYVAAEEELNINTLRMGLLRELPDYMVPGYLMRIEKIPVTQNGKLDKKGLPEIQAKTENAYVEPENEKEAILSKVFKEILGIERVSVKDSFFELGGDSIKGIRVVSKVREAGYDMNIKDVMSGQTIEEISEKLKKAEVLSYEQGEVKGSVKATPILQIFKNWELKEPHHFNQAMMIKVDGNETQVEAAIKALVNHHDMLRSVYRAGNLEIRKYEENCYEFEAYDYRNEDKEEEKIEEKCEEKQRSMDLEKGPLFKSVLYKVKEENYLFLCMHHLIVDGISWRILIEDIHSGIKQQKEGKEIKLPKKTASYQEWSEALLEYKESKKLEKEKSYWKEIEKEIKEGSYKGEKQEESGYGAVALKLNEEETKKLLTDSKKAYNTEINDLLLSGLGMAVKEVRGQDKVTIGLEGHGREALHKKIEVDRTVGWFTSMYPVILECHKEIEKSIIRTKEMLRKVPNHGIGYGLLRENKAESDISFNYLGEMEEGKETEKIYSTGTSISEKNRLPGSITINGSVQRGELIFVINYDRSMYTEKEIKALAQAYGKKLKEEILHCCSRQEAIKTPSDFTGNDITDGELDALYDLL